MMRLALAMAKRAQGRVEPNPMVGCVIVKNGRIIGRGFHRRFGDPHAEVEALRDCAVNPRGTTAYVTLEPCSHLGKTPPCVGALIEAGIARVVIPLRDPNPLVNGSGVRALRRAGIRVDIGVLADEAAELLAPFLTRVRLGRPYVIAKWAQSADGLLVTPSGRSKWISCKESRRRVHQLRARVDAIMVGAGTVLADDPMLTTRDVPIRRRALRIVVDGRLRIPRTCRLVRTADQLATVVFTTPRAAASTKAKLLQRCGVEVVACRARAERISLPEMLRSRLLHDVTNLLVEGGPTLLNAFFAASLIDEAQVFIAPKPMAAARSTGPRRVLVEGLAESLSLQGGEGGLRGRPDARLGPTPEVPLPHGRRRRGEGVPGRTQAPHTVTIPTPARVLRRRSGDDRLLSMRFA